MEGACDSPSSDKENASQENLKKEPQSKEEESRRESLCKTYLLFILIHDVFQYIQKYKIIFWPGIVFVYNAIFVTLITAIYIKPWLNQGELKIE